MTYSWGCWWCIRVCLAYWHIDLNNKRQNIKEDNMMGSYLGNEFSQNEIQNI